MLFVCTGNICRSPLAELLWRSRLDPALVRVSSAGTRALVDAGMPTPAQAIARSWGVSAEVAAGHRPRALSVQLIDEADLVVALAREHRADVARTVAAATRRTVTLREAVRLLTSLAEAPTVDAHRLRSLAVPDALRELVPLALAERGVALGAQHPDDDDVIDPYRREDHVYAQSAAQILTATDALMAALTTIVHRDQ